MEERKVKLNGTAIAGQTLHNRPRIPNVILGDDAGYIRGDILDANAVQTKILELIGGAPEILDTLKELADALDDDPTIIKTLKTWYNNIKGITVSHINHDSTARADDHPSFTATATQVALNYDCFNLTSGNNTNHAGTNPETGDLLGAILPQASTTLAGTIDASAYTKITNLTTYSHVHHSSDGTSDTQDTFTADANSVKLNFLCTATHSGETWQYHSPIPVASTTQAGIITASTYADILNTIDAVTPLVDRTSPVPVYTVQIDDTLKKSVGQNELDYRLLCIRQMGANESYRIFDGQLFISEDGVWYVKMSPSADLTPITPNTIGDFNSGGTISYNKVQYVSGRVLLFNGMLATTFLSGLSCGVKSILGGSVLPASCSTPLNYVTSDLKIIVLDGQRIDFVLTTASNVDINAYVLFNLKNGEISNIEIGINSDEYAIFLPLVGSPTLTNVPLTIGDKFKSLNKDKLTALTPESYNNTGNSVVFYVENRYIKFKNAVNTFTFTIASNATASGKIIKSNIFLTTGSSPNISFAAGISGHTVYKQSDLTFAANSTYLIDIIIDPINKCTIVRGNKLT